MHFNNYESYDLSDPYTVSINRTHDGPGYMLSAFHQLHCLVSNSKTSKPRINLISPLSGSHISCSISKRATAASTSHKKSPTTPRTVSTTYGKRSCAPAIHRSRARRRLAPAGARCMSVWITMRCWVGRMRTRQRNGGMRLCLERRSCNGQVVGKIFMMNQLCYPKALFCCPCLCVSDVHL